MNMLKKAAMIACLAVVAFVGVLQLSQTANAGYEYCDVACYPSCSADTPCWDRICHQPGPYSTNCYTYCSTCN